MRRYLTNTISGRTYNQRQSMIPRFTILKLEIEKDHVESSPAGEFDPFEKYLVEVEGRLPWVAEIIGYKNRYLEREFLREERDLLVTGCFGPSQQFGFLCFKLQEGKIYEVFGHFDRGYGKRYFCKFSGGRIVKLTKHQVLCAVT